MDGLQTHGNKLILSVICIVMLTACGGPDSGANFENLPTDKVEKLEKIYYFEATLEDVSEYVFMCNGNHDKICIQICHRPPGNPENEKSKILPLTAMNAHLNHGGDYIDQDHLGECEGDIGSGNGENNNSGEYIDQNHLGECEGDIGSGNGENNNSGEEDGNHSDGSDNGDSTGDNSGDSSNNGDTGDSGNGDSETPIWCQQVADIDSNCDGFNDETGEPVF